MLTEILNNLDSWSSFNSWTVVIAALAAMSCAIPGVFLLLRRQSMMGDALSHSVLLGIVGTMLIVQSFKAMGWIDSEQVLVWRHTFYFVGAVGIGVLCALLTEFIQSLGKVESSASLGVVFTSLFALGLLLIRLEADGVEVHPDCVLYGNVDTAAVATVSSWNIPKDAIWNGIVLLLNLICVVLFYKELQISTFDPDLADSLGFPARLIHYSLMMLASVTLIVAFESVGSILVIAMLITPPATAYLLTNRLSHMIGYALLIAAITALVGHAMAVSVPEVIFSRLGYPNVRGVSTAGMMAVCSVGLFLVAALFAPQLGLVSKWRAIWKLNRRICAEDLLGLLYRMEEAGATIDLRNQYFQQAVQENRFTNFFAVRWLLKTGRIRIPTSETGYVLTESGRALARKLVRSHRLWESYVAKHFAVAQDQYHESAHRAEHFVDETARKEIAKELEQPLDDPHGQTIPEEM